MDSHGKLSLFLVLFLAFIIPVTSQPPQPQPQSQACESYKFPNTARNFQACNDLPVLDSSLHWNYHSSSNSIDVAFKKNNAKHNGWISWAINPTSTGMVGSQAFVAFHKSDGTMVAYTSPITSYATMLEEGSLSFEDVHGVSASFEDGTMILYASFKLPGNSSTLVNHVWQEGPVSDDGNPQPHAFSGPNLKSVGQIDFLSGKVSDSSSLQNSKITIRKVHGIMNGIGWGILMPIGAIIGHYVRRIEAPAGTSTWFHLHRACQFLAYLMGTVGFSLGFFISRSSFSFSSLSPAASAHASIGIAVFTSTTIQVLTAIFLRPNKTHKARIFWNIFHYVVGYGIIILSIFNVFKGYSISNTYPKFWRNPYLAAVVSLGCMALIFQLIHWFLLCKTKSRNNNKINTTMEQVSGDNGNIISHQEIV